MYSVISKGGGGASAPPPPSVFFFLCYPTTNKSRWWLGRYPTTNKLFRWLCRYPTTNQLFRWLWRYPTTNQSWPVLRGPEKSWRLWRTNLKVSKKIIYFYFFNITYWKKKLISLGRLLHKRRNGATARDQLLWPSGAFVTEAIDAETYLSKKNLYEH